MSIADTIRRTFVPVRSEGYPFIAAFAVVALFLGFFSTSLFWIGVILTGWCAYFFRDPERIVPTDDRLVPMGDPLSNITAIGKVFVPKGARVFPITSEKAEDYKAAGRAADARLQDLHWPLDLCLLGVGGDGHTASIFPGPDLDEALNGPRERRALGVMPDPLPPEAPVARVTLSRASIITAKALMIAVSGQAKRDVIEQAIEQGQSSPFPIGRVLAEAELPVDIHWSE